MLVGLSRVKVTLPEHEGSGQLLGFLLFETTIAIKILALG